MSIEAIESTRFPEFYEIPHYSNYVLSKTGRVLNKTNLKELAGSRNPDGYYNFRIVSDHGKCHTWGRHRLLGYVFKHPGIDIIDLVVNHKNGIKGDDRLDNLEWKTYQGNAEHAGESGLTTKCIPIFVRNALTGLVVKYPSAIKCATDLGVSKDTILWRLRSPPSRIFPEQRQYRAYNDNRPWTEGSKIDLENLKKGKSIQIVIRNVVSGEEVYMDQAQQAARLLNVSPATMTLWLTLPGQPVLPGLIQLKMRNDPTPWRQVFDPYLELEKFNNEKVVRVQNTLTGEISMYPSAIKCAIARDIKPAALNYRLKSMGKTTYSDGCRYSYYRDHIQSKGPTSAVTPGGAFLN